jgi:hypothetical protein
MNCRLPSSHLFSLSIPLLTCPSLAPPGIAPLTAPGVRLAAWEAGMVSEGGNPRWDGGARAMKKRK